jgi:hypothetical protein
MTTIPITALIINNEIRMTNAARIKTILPKRPLGHSAGINELKFYET